MRYFIEIAYKGTDFHGWQKQPNAVSVQDEIQQALKKVFRKKIEIIGAGRTDSGVHAKQLFAHFDTDKIIDEKSITYRINSIIPQTITINTIFKVPDTVHARFDAIFRSYEYHIHLTHNPFLLDTTWQIHNQKFNIHKMNKAADILLRHTNFKAFSKSKTDVKTYDCAISKARWFIKENQLVFHITANRFLRNMVRAIVGTLLEVGKGKLKIADFEKIILSQDRSNAGLSVPAQGLFLTEVGYTIEVLKNRD